MEMKYFWSNLIEVNKMNFKKRLKSLLEMDSSLWHESIWWIYVMAFFVADFIYFDNNQFVNVLDRVLTLPNGQTWHFHQQNIMQIDFSLYLISVGKNDCVG